MIIIIIIINLWTSSSIRQLILTVSYLISHVIKPGGWSESTDRRFVHIL